MDRQIRRYPHSDLGNLAYYHRQVINEKVANGERDGTSLDCTSFLIALAFTVEALVNFVGSKKVAGWRERDAYATKMKAIAACLGLLLDETKEPYATLGVLKEVRDQLAHGKPAEFTKPASSRSELRMAMAAPWDQHLNPTFVNHAYDQVAEFKRSLFKAACIKLGATLTSADPEGRIV